MLQLTTYNDASSPVDERSVCDVGVTGDPANVSRAPVHVIRLVVKVKLESGGRIQHVACLGV